YQKEYQKLVEKSCICVGLGTSALLVNDLDTRREGKGVSICPGPNMAYFSSVVSLQEMVDHIYGRTNIIPAVSRPHMFIKELGMYVEYLKKEVAHTLKPIQEKKLSYFNNFRENLLQGIDYYNN